MIDAWWLILGIGVFIGFFVGRGSAEYFRARFDRQVVWNNRRRYRS